MSTQSVASPWHAGELAIQQRAGVIDRMAEIGRRNIRSYMPEQHRQFFGQLPFVVLGTVDEAGDAWATLRAGHPGFVHSPDPHVLQVRIPRDTSDPASPGFGAGKALGLLGIDLKTRRRNRMNGSIARTDAERIDINVGQSFGNCPQYIHQRAFEFTREPDELAHIAPVITNSLDDRARQLISSAVTFFVATYSENAADGAGRQVDVSHRGGKPGFVRLDADGGMTIPDFAGNLFFNTLGNILANGKAGLVFADFATGALLQLSGDAEVILDSPEIAAFQGAERLWHFVPRRVVYRADALPVRWKDLRDGASPNALMTGNWDEAASRIKAAALAQSWRKLRVAKIVDESSVVRSFHLEPADDAGLIAHQAGQHLPIRVTIAPGEAPVIRTYTLSTAPSDSTYRISVKREGRVSSYLHDTLKVGDLLETRAPAGGFTIDALEKRPAVLIAAGIGITPMLAMARHIVYEGLRKRRVRPTWLFQSAKSVAMRAFSGELHELSERSQGELQVIRALTKPQGARKGIDFDFAGRIDMDLLRAVLPFDDYDFYLCGPTEFMQSLYDGLRALNVADNRIHAEAFGPSSFKRSVSTDRGAPAKPMNPIAEQPAPVMFIKSGKEARWMPGGGSLLELAEERGLSPAFSCRGGSCGTCRTRIVQGAVAYAQAPSFDVPDGEALICCAFPAASTEENQDALQLDL
jgi:ferredoxin-NADP reductase/predicted pyridoxine 5'-phosphate oxidase superfamily flavin-nucleotide-binding protein